MAQVKLDQTIWLLTVKKTIRCAFLLAEDQTIYPKYRKWKKKSQILLLMVIHYSCFNFDPYYIY